MYYKNIYLVGGFMAGKGIEENFLRYNLFFEKIKCKI